MRGRFAETPEGGLTPGIDRIALHQWPAFISSIWRNICKFPPFLPEKALMY